MTLVAPPRVFLSYARQDGEEFATALRRRLAIEEPEITLWQDRAQMEGGVGWWAQIEAALDHVKFLVIVMTPHAGRSETTRKEWRCARQRGVVVYPVKGVPDAQLDYAALPGWMRNSHFFDIGRFAEGEWKDSKEWETFVNYLKSDRQPVRVPFMAPDLPTVFVPRRHELEQLCHLLLEPAREHPVAITATLQGAGGYGKTTLAIALCHDERMVEAFDDGVLWTTLGQTPQVVDEVGRLYAALTGQHVAFVDATDAAAKLAEKLEHRRCLLILDDVWERGHLEPFLKGGKQCARLITTRRFDLVDRAARVRVDQMTLTDAVRFLSKALEPDTIADDKLAPLAKRLGEWPLLLKLAGGIMRKRLNRGDSADGGLSYVVRALDKRGVTAFDQSEKSQRNEAVRGTVAASLDQLSADDGRRFRELAIFPKDTAIPLSTLERLWGLDDLDTVDCAQRLDDVSLLSVDLRRGVVTLHDVMRMYLLAELGDAPRVHARLVAGYENVEHLPDAYAWRWLPYHLLHAGQGDALRALLLSPEWLQAKLRVADPASLIRDFDLLNGDRDLEVIQAGLRLALPTLVADASQLAEQLLGRLPVGFSDRLDAFRHDLARAAPRPRLHARWPNLQEPGGALVQTLPHDSVKGAFLLPDGRALSWSGDALRVWDLSTGESRTLTGHQKSVDGALPAPDGRALSWSDDNTLRIWDLATGDSRELIRHQRRVHAVLPLSDAQVLSCSADGTLRLWDLATGESRTETIHDGLVNGALQLSDGRVLAWSGDGPLRVLDFATGDGRTLMGHVDSVHGALMLPDGRALSWSADGTLRVWDLATGESRALTGHAGSVYGAMLLPEGRALSWSGDGTLRIWDLETGEGRPLTGHRDRVDAALLLPDGRLLSCSADGTLRVWDLATHESHTLTGHRGSVSGALVLPDGRALSWGADGTLRVWDLMTGEGRALTGHGGWVYGALMLSDEGALSWSEDGTLRVWGLGTGQGRTLTGHEHWVHGALLLPDSRALSWSADGTLRVWDLMTGEGGVLTGHKDFVYGALLLPDGRALSWSGDRTLRVWDLAARDGNALVGHEDSVHGALQLPNGRALSWSADGTLRVWDVSTGESRALTGHEDWVHGVLLLPDGRPLSWSEDGTLRVWHLATGQSRALTGHEGSVHGAVLLPDGRALSWSGDGTLRMWDLETGHGVVVSGHEGWVRGALLLPGSRVLSWGADGTLLLSDLTTGDRRTLTGHNGLVNGVLLLPDERAVSWGVDRTLQLWDLATGERRAFADHEAPVHGALLLPGERVLSWSADRSIRVTDINSRDASLAFYFDAVPTVVLPNRSDGFLVGDALGRIHALELLDRGR